MSEFNRERQFTTGADRSSDNGKIHYERAYTPLVMERFGQYCREHNIPKGRREDQWQLGFPQETWVDSGYRHFHAWWALHRGYPVTDENGNAVDMEEAICGLIFNAQGYLHQLLLAKMDSAAKEKVSAYIRNVNPAKT